MKKIVLSLLLGLLLVPFSFGQITAPNVQFGATPTAAALAKYADTPVGHYSGVPNINIPLYTINTPLIPGAINCL